MVFMRLVSVYFVLQATEISNPLFNVGSAVTLTGVIIEHIADEQLYSWRTKHSTGLIDKGLWR